MGEHPRLSRKDPGSSPGLGSAGLRATARSSFGVAVDGAGVPSTAHWGWPRRGTAEGVASMAGESVGAWVSY